MSDCGISAKPIVARVESVPAPNSRYLGCRWQESRLQLTQCCLRAANNTKTETCCHGDLSRCFCGDSAGFASIGKRFSAGKTDQVLKVAVMLFKGDLFSPPTFLMFSPELPLNVRASATLMQKHRASSHKLAAIVTNLHSLLALESPPPFPSFLCLCCFYSALYSRRSCSCLPSHHFFSTVSKVSAADLMLCGSAVIWPRRVATQRPVSSWLMWRSSERVWLWWGGREEGERCWWVGRPAGRPDRRGLNCGCTQSASAQAQEVEEECGVYVCWDC